jgi:DNA-binding CsgD family transcriptional regulator
VTRLEIRGPQTHDVLPLEGPRLSIGSGDASDLTLSSDPSVSRVHVLFEHVGDVWTVRDVGSRNGTFVNSTRLLAERTLRDGDEVLIGRTRLIFRDPGRRSGPTTERLQPPPTLTAREHEVLVWLCRPLLLGNAFTAPASVREIAAGLVVTPAAVKQHLARLYAKFAIDDVDSEMRRARLANAALSRGAITLADLQPISR